MGRAEARRAAKQSSRRRPHKPRPGGKTGKGGIRRFFTWRKLLGTFFGFCLLCIGGAIGLYLWVDEPSTGNIAARMQSNVYKWSDGSVLTRTGEINREIVDLSRIPKGVQQTFIAAENKSFYKDSGVDVKGIARGVLNTLTGKGKQGGSTITQQYVKNYYLNQDQTATRKLKELVISLKVDRRMEKKDILAGYINTNYYGRGAYGIQAAAQAYYGVDTAKLTVEQGAYLAALLQAPNQYDWALATPTGKRLVTERWNYVLANMVEMGELDEPTRAGMKFPVPIKPKPAPGMEGQKGYLVQAADEELKRQGISEDQIKAGGWTITLTVDKKKQAKLEKAVDQELESKLDRESRKVDAGVQAGATSVDPKTGHIVAMYGGQGLKQHWSNNAIRTDYQPGSTFKPIVLASALENDSRTQDGRPITPKTIYDGTSRRPVEGSDTFFNPQNQDDRSYGKRVTVQKATNSSLNSVYAQMLVDVGPGTVKKTALEMGMTDRPGWPEQPAMALGSMSATTVEMAGVYATLDHHGRRITPTIVKSAEHKDREYHPVDPIGTQVLSRQTADTVTKVLTGVVRNGSARVVSSSAYEAAAKTGTTESNKAAWFTGYTPELVTVVAMFGEKPDGTGQTTLTGTAGAGRAGGSSFPAEIWRAYTLSVLGGTSTDSFDLEADMGRSEVKEEADPTRKPSPSPSRSEKKDPSPSPSPSRSEKKDPSPSPSPSRTRKTDPSPSPSRTKKPPKTSPTPPDPTLDPTLRAPQP
ncbi:transglycosylase domain-containing protein [Streptomyces sp. NPDC006879]|uniref:transglycosylase domain-containing protein n=1 Tax=Streptomyces sp. NPDC006879 TaxID=3364767 RepID=UPI0036CCA89A